MFKKLFTQFNQIPKDLSKIDEYFRIHELSFMVNLLIFLAVPLIADLMIENNTRSIWLVLVSTSVWIVIRLLIRPSTVQALSFFTVLASYLFVGCWVIYLPFNISTIRLVLFAINIFVVIQYDLAGLLVHLPVSLLAFFIIIYNHQAQWWPAQYSDPNSAMVVWFFLGAVFVGLSFLYKKNTQKALIELAFAEIDRRKQIEHDLTVREAQYRLVTENSVDVPWVYEPDQQRFTFVSPSLVSLLGYHPDELHNETAAILFSPPEELPRKQKILNERAMRYKKGILATNRFSDEITMLHRDGHPVYVEATSTLHPGQNGGAIIIGNLRDISQRKENQDLLLESERNLAVYEEREQLGRTLHDELGQVFTFLASTAQTGQRLLKNNKLSEVETILKNNAEISTRSLEQMRGFITRLMAHEEHSQPTSFWDAFNQLIDKFREESGIETMVSTGKTVGKGTLPPKSEEVLLRVVNEALTNIAKHAKASVVSVSIQTTADQLLISIADNGVGFNRNQQLAEFKRSPGGHFGLMIMQERMEQIGGSFEIASRQGKGTQVLLGASFGQPSDTPMAVLHSSKVLIGYTQPLFLEAMASVLSNNGIMIVAKATNEQEVLDRALVSQPNIALIDAEMDGAGGAQLTRSLLAIDPNLRVVVLTSSQDPSEANLAIAAGARGSIHKDSTITAMLARLAEIATS